MKYNKSKIMKKAWELRKENGIAMSEALKLAWAEAKGTQYGKDRDRAFAGGY